MKFYTRILHKSVLICLLFVVSIYSYETYSQDAVKPTTRDLAVLLTASVQKSPAIIKLNWIKNPLAISYSVSRKPVTSQIWTLLTSTPLSANDSTYTDQYVRAGDVYEYEVIATQTGLIPAKTFDNRDTNIVTNFNGYGYVCSGVEANIPTIMGKIILIVDETIDNPLSEEIATLTNDMTNEGWTVIKKTTPRAEQFDGAAVRAVKAMILNEYNSDQQNVKAVFLLGRVPVPYSGRINPDGHPDHLGAWPADLYYGYMNEKDWVDSVVSDTTGSRKEQWNVPGDGKFDLSSYYGFGKVELMVGRVDLYNMPDFSSGEVELLRAYLNKDHKYRTGQINVTRQALIADNFGMYTLEAFGQNGWRNFAPIVGPDKINTPDWFTALTGDSYLFIHGNGPGGYESASGLGGTTDFASKQINAIFTSLFGSYFGDWDNKNNFLRAPLCSQPDVLTCAWTGRPSWFYHHMGLGYPVGYSAKVTMNNNDLYYACLYNFPGNGWINPLSSSNMRIHVALMGDPTIKIFDGNIEPPKNLTLVQPAGLKVQISWEAPADPAIAGYNVYYSANPNGPFKQINTTMVTDIKFTDPTIRPGEIYYMIKSLKLMTSPSGTYYEPSAGINKSIVITGVDDDNQVSAYAATCSPNPASLSTNISITLPVTSRVLVNIYDMNGNIVNNLVDMELSSGTHNLAWNLSDLTGQKVNPGVYFARIQDQQSMETLKIVVMP